MSYSEFDLIDHFFKDRKIERSDVTLGIGDDAALLNVPAGMELAVSMDTMVEGVHFFEGANPEDLGYKLMAVNLSDLAAMGADPAWASLALTLPSASKKWLEFFCRGMFALADEYEVALIGGDTTCGPLTLSLQIFGFAPKGKAMRRKGAKPGDIVYVSNTIGDAGFVLKNTGRSAWRDDVELLEHRLLRPSPRVAAGLLIRDLATAAIDISDGLVADLGHILKQSGVGARIELDQIPLSDPVRRYLQRTGDWQMPLGAGDDYELCFTIDAEDSVRLEALDADVDFYPIGRIEQASGLRVITADGGELAIDKGGYRHFDEGDHHGK